MRRLMRGKRRKSESPSDAESEENGGNAHNSDDAEQTKLDNDDGGESAPKSKRKSVRGRDTNKFTTTNDTPMKKCNENDTGDESSALNHENGDASKNFNDKRRKKDERKATTSQDNIENNQEYEVERIVSSRTIKGRRQFLIRWKGYEEDADTWEDENELNCSKLIDDFLIDKELEEENGVSGRSGESKNSKEDDSQENDDQPKKSTKNKRPKATKRTRKSTKVAKKQNDRDKIEHNENENDEKSPAGKKTKKLRGTRQQNNNVKKRHNEHKSDDEENEFEVEKIIDVYFKKNKSREFLIRWKGFSASEDTWEPEANLNCPELIQKFMDKVEKAKNSDLRELRTNPSHTKRYTLTMQSRGRRLSRRNAGKERTTYHECDE